MSLQQIADERTKNTWSAETELANAEKYAQMYSDALDIQYAAGIQNLTDQKNNIAATYDPYRAGVNAQYERSVRSNDEQMANLGLSRSGTNLTNQIRLSNERARGMAEVDSDQAKAAQELQAQINEYIAQRDSAKAQERATAYQSAYTNISSQQRTLAQMAQQNQYDIQLAELDYAHDEEMAKLNHEYAIAEMNNDYAKKAQLEKEMAALEYSYSLQKIERQAQLDDESYAKKAATDWDYYQQQAALDSELSLDEYKAKAATDWGYTQKQLALENSYDLSLINAKNAASSSGNDSEIFSDLSTTISSVSGLSDAAKNAYNQCLIALEHYEYSDSGYGEALAKANAYKAAGHLTDAEYVFLIQKLGL